jgi:hypothetical protein
MLIPGSLRSIFKIFLKIGCFRQKIKVRWIFTGYCKFLSKNWQRIRFQGTKMHKPWKNHQNQSTFRIKICQNLPISQILTLKLFWKSKISCLSQNVPTLSTIFWNFETEAGWKTLIYLKIVVQKLFVMIFDNFLANKC